ncbi:MAG: hypothetical protein DMF56_13260 [Acidobacteria bacterium]|nr:MAG: hypothetical protein DMF56_13260 [Acidobacteriota bacterium]
MKRAFTATTLSILLFMVIVFGCRSGVDTSKPETQKQFGVRMAKMNLWREAMFRFKRAVDMKPEDATAHNNLAVAYEANGDFENALKEYREALRLDRTNQYIQKNYSRLVEFTTRAKKGPRAPGTPADTTTAAPQPNRNPLPGAPPTQPVDTRTPEPLIPSGPTDTAVTAPPPPGDLP